MSSVKCPQCNLTNWATAINCKRCGYFFQPVEGVTPEANTTFGDGQNFQTPFASQEKYQSAGFQPNYQSSWSPPNYQNHQTNYQPPPLKSGLAIASMVIGIIGCFLFAPIGLILGIVALVKANKKSSEYGGQGFAIAGVVLNSIGLFLILPIILAIAIPNLLAARRAANEGSAISVVRTLAGAEQTFRATAGKGRCGDLKTLQSANMIDAVTAGGQKNGYSFMVINLPTLNGDCAITATPLSTSHGTRSFYYSTEDSVLRAAKKNGQSADMYDLPLDGENSSPSRSQYPKITEQKTNPYSK